MEPIELVAISVLDSRALVIDPVMVARLERSPINR